MGWRFRKLFRNIQCTSACCKSTVSASLEQTMDAASSFYITLPSNACKDIYPGNTASVYKTRLVKPINLKYPYEVALVEMQYPHTWNTLDDTCNDFYYTDGRGNYNRVCVPAGYYDSPKKLTDELNKAFEEEEKKRLPIGAAAEKQYNNVIFMFDQYSRRTEIYIKNDYNVQLNTALAQALGFSSSSRVYSEPKSVSDNAADTLRGFYSLYVYCDLCEPQFVGDAYVPLLRIVDARGKDKQIITKTYAQPHYIPVMKSFDTVEINIKDDTGEDVSFTSGKVICKLHFRIKR